MLTSCVSTCTECYRAVTAVTEVQYIPSAVRTFNNQHKERLDWPLLNVILGTFEASTKSKQLNKNPIHSFNMTHWAASVHVLLRDPLEELAWIKHAYHPSSCDVSHSSYSSNTHTRLTEDRQGGEKYGRRRSSGFFPLLIARGKQRRQSESVTEKVWGVWGSKKERRGEGKNRGTCIRGALCDVKLCALLTLGLCVSWEHTFELYCCCIWQPELWVCQENWDRYLTQVRKKWGAQKCGESKQVRQV